MDAAEDPLLTGRNETPLQRCDRNLAELLQEVRVVQTGVQVLPPTAHHRILFRCGDKAGARPGSVRLLREARSAGR